MQNNNKKNNKFLDYDKRNDKKRSWEEESPASRHGDERFRTPKYHLKDTPSRSSWEEDEHHQRKVGSKWEVPTPKSRHGNYSARNDRNGKKYDTPLPTPTYKQNKWAGDRKTKVGGSDGDASDDDEWNEDQRVCF